VYTLKLKNGVSRLEIAGGGKDLIWLEMVDHQFSLDTFHFSIFFWAANIVVGQFWYVYVFSYYNIVEFNYNLQCNTLYVLHSV
jgi:hypothetical protein